MPMSWHAPYRIPVDVCTGFQKACFWHSWEQKFTCLKWEGDFGFLMSHMTCIRVVVSCGMGVPKPRCGGGAAAIADVAEEAVLVRSMRNTLGEGVQAQVSWQSRLTRWCPRNSWNQAAELSDATIATEQ